MSRFTVNLIDEYGQPYSVWESDDISEAWYQVECFETALDAAIGPRSGQLEEIIRDLRSQIEEAEAEESEATMQAIADLVFPAAPWQRA